MEIRHDLTLFLRVLAVAFAVGFDVFAVSIGVGVAQLALDSILRVGFAFAGSEIAMQAIGYELGAGAGHMLGEVAAYAGFTLLAAIGFVMIRASLRRPSEEEFDATREAGLLITSLSISLDSLGVGIALPAVSIPLLPLLTTVSITTTFFTLIGLAFGAHLGERYERGAERTAGTARGAGCFIRGRAALMSFRARLARRADRLFLFHQIKVLACTYRGDVNRRMVGTPKGPRNVTVSNPKGTKKKPGLTVLMEGVSGGVNPYTVTNGCDTPLAPGAQCTIGVTFTPTASGTQDGTLMIMDNAEHEPQIVQLKGKGK